MGVYKGGSFGEGEHTDKSKDNSIEQLKVTIDT